MIDIHGKIKIAIGIIIFILAIVSIAYYMLHSSSAKGNEIANVVFIFVGFASLFVVFLNVVDEIRPNNPPQPIHIIHSIPNAQIIQTSPNTLTIKMPDNAQITQPQVFQKENLIFS